VETFETLKLSFGGQTTGRTQFFGWFSKKGGVASVEDGECS
jgi:hypothetical protein